MADGDELKVSAALLKALDLAPDEAAEPSPTLILAACLQQLAVECGLVEREDAGFSWVAHAIPEEPLRLLTDVISPDAELNDDALRDWFYDALLDISGDSVARKALNRTSAVSREEALEFSQIYWNLESDGRRAELPIRSGQKLASGLMARIKSPKGDKDLAYLDLKNRAAPAGFPNGGGAYYARGARIAVLIADRITRNNAALTVGQARLRATQTGRGVEWSIIWEVGEHAIARRPSRNAVKLLAPAGLTSKARARHAIDSYEQDLRRAVDRHIPDELGPESVYGHSLYTKLRNRQASANDPDIDTMTPYLHPEEAREVLLRHDAELPVDLSDALRASIVKFDRYSPVRNRVMRGRPLQPDDLDAVESFISQFQSTEFPQTSLALEQLASDEGWQPKSRPGSAPPELILHNLPDPDFDETGLLGRDELVDEIVALVGRRRRRKYPIMLRGEGGIGKTALALEVAYRFLDDPASPFEAILWTSLKTERLTSEGVQDLSSALRDLGGVATSLGKVIDPTFQGSVAELDDAIGDRMTLIVVDNLETLHGDEFFALDDALGDRDVTFLLTSRVGVGDRTETRVVGPLDELSATRLFRRFARGSGSNELAAWTDARISDTVRELRYSPLAIRWYILSVASGKPPTDALRDQGELLRFCIENVVEGLGDAETLLLQVLHVLDRPVSFEHLAVISEIEIDALRRGIKILTQRSLLVRTQAPDDDEGSDLLSLSSTTTRFLPPVPESDLVEDIYRRERALHQDREKDRRRIAEHGRTFNPKSVFWRSTSDGTVAHLLERALRESQAGDAAAASKTMDRARDISSGYFEVDRIDAFFASISGRADKATAFYKSALASCETEEERCWVGYFYSGHLAHGLRDFPAAIELAEATHAYFGTHDTANRLGNLYVSNRQFADAQRLFSWAVDNALSDKFRRQATTSLIASLREWSRADLASSAFVEALDHALRATDLGVEMHAAGFTDDKLVRAIIDTTTNALRSVREMPDVESSPLERLASALQVMESDAAFRANDSWRLVEYALASIPGDHRSRLAPWFTGSVVENGATFTEVVVNETRRIVGDLSRPASLSEVSGQLIRSLGEDARRTWAELGTFKAFLAYAVPSAHIVTDRPPGWVIPEGFPLDHPLPDPRAAAPLVNDDPALMVVVDEVRQIVGEFTRPATLTEVSALLTRALGDDAKEARDKFKSFKAFLEYALPTAQIVAHNRHKWVVLPDGVSPDQPLPDTWFGAPLVDDDPALTEAVANELRQIVGRLGRPASLAEMSGRLNWSLGPDASRTWMKYKTFKAFVAFAVPTAQILTDRAPGWVYPEGVPLDHPLPESWFAPSGDHDDEALTDIVASETRRIVAALTRAAPLKELSTGLIRTLGPDAKRAWAKSKGFKAFLAYAVPTARIFSDDAGWVVPEGVTPDTPLIDPWLPPTRHSPPLVIDDDPALTETVANEARRIIGEFSRPATLAEVSALLTRSLGDGAKQTWAKFKSFKAFLEYAVPTAQIVTDRPPRWVLPAGVTPDPLIAAPPVDDDDALTQVVANEARRIIGDFSGPATPADIAARLAWTLGPDAKRAWAKPRTFKKFLAHAVPTAQILPDSRHGFVVLPVGVSSDHSPRDPSPNEPPVSGCP